MLIEGLSIKTTSLCQRQCKYCTVRPWMSANPDYHTPLGDIEKLINLSKKHGLIWNYILLSGGEPLLWDNVIQGCKMLYHSKVTPKLVLLTNGLAVEDEECLQGISDIVEHVDNFRISRYGNNGTAIDMILNEYGSTGKIEVTNRLKHMVAPSSPVPNSLPADCHCRAYSMVHGMIDSCGPARTLCTEDPSLELGRVEYTTRIENFYAYYVLKKPDRFNVEECSWCIANSKVAKILPRENS